MSSSLRFLNNPDYSITIDFAVRMEVTIAITERITMDIITGNYMTAEIGYGSQTIDIGTTGTTDEQAITEAQKLDGTIADFPRLE